MTEARFLAVAHAEKYLTLEQCWLIDDKQRSFLSIGALPPQCGKMAVQLRILSRTVVGKILDHMRAYRERGVGMAKPKFHTEDPLKKLVEAASRRHLAELFYRKGVTRSALPVRLVEPYNLTQGKQDAMVRCFQRRPQEGWRFFMIHKLDRVSDTGISFTPRAKITLPTGEIQQEYEENSAWTWALKQYRDLVGDALADGVVTREEWAQIKQFRMKNKITIEQVRFVHATIFHRCLGAVLDDDLVDDDERAQIRFLHKVLSRLGWTVSE